MSIILSTLFIYSPYILQRMYSHTSLAGRFVWGYCYLLNIASIFVFFNMVDLKKFKKGVVAFFLVAIQLVDLYPHLIEIKCTEKYRHYIKYQPKTTQKKWKSLLGDNKHFVFVPFGIFSFDGGGADLALLTVKNGGDVNTFYFARETKQIEKFDKILDEELLNGIYRDSTIYIFSKDSIKKISRLKTFSYWVSSFPSPLFTPSCYAFLMERKIGIVLSGDGGVSCNVPLVPLLREHCTHALVVVLSPNDSICGNIPPGMRVACIRPSVPLSRLGVLDFSCGRIRKLVSLGYADCKRALVKGKLMAIGY